MPGAMWIPEKRLTLAPVHPLVPSPVPSSVPSPLPQAAHILTQATKSLCRARFSSYEACAAGEGTLPVHAPLRHLELSEPGALGYSWQQVVVEKVRAEPGQGGRALRAACLCRMFES